MVETLSFEFAALKLQKLYKLSWHSLLGTIRVPAVSKEVYIYIYCML